MERVPRKVDNKYREKRRVERQAKDERERRRVEERGKRRSS